MTTMRIFVIYNTKDAEFATQLITDLRHSGIEVITDNVGTVGTSRASDPTSTDLDETISEQFLSEQLPQCQHLIMVQTPEALQSPYVLAIVDTTLQQVQAGQMKEVLRVIAPTLDEPKAQPVPPTWANTPEFDASQDYPRALARLCLHLGIGTDEVHDVPPPPASSISPLDLPNAQETGNKAPLATLLDAQRSPGEDRPLRSLTYPSDLRRTGNKSPLAAPAQDQRFPGEDRPLRPLRYPRRQFRQRLFLLTFAMSLILSIAAVTVLINQNLTHAQSSPAAPAATIHTPLLTTTQASSTQASTPTTPQASSTQAPTPTATTVPPTNPPATAVPVLPTNPPATVAPVPPTAAPTPTAPPPPPTPTPRPVCSILSTWPSTKSYINIWTTAIGRAGTDNTCAQVGQSYTSTNPQYVWCRRWGGEVIDSQGNFNHWWLWTDLDTGGRGWISAYYIQGQGNDVANDMYTGKAIPGC